MYGPDLIPIILGDMPDPLIRHPPAPGDVQHGQVHGVGGQCPHSQVGKAVDVAQRYFWQPGEDGKEVFKDIVIQLPASSEVHLC